MFGFLRWILGSQPPVDPAAEARRRLAVALDRAATEIVAPALGEILAEPEFAGIVGAHATGLQVCWARKVFAPNERAIWHFGAAGLFDIALNGTGRLTFQIMPSLDAARHLGSAVSWTGTGTPLFYNRSAVGRIEAMPEFTAEIREVMRTFATDLAEAAHPPQGCDPDPAGQSPSEPQAAA